MTKAERELLIEEKNRILGQKKDSELKNISKKRNLFFHSNSDCKMKERNINFKNSLISDDDLGLLKVL